MRYRIPRFGILLFALAALLPARAAAQSVGISPAQVVQSFKPGVPFEIELASVNRGLDPVQMNVEITDLWYNEKNEKVFSTSGTSPRSAANWIQFVPERFEIPANGTQKMRAVVTPPADASGGYYATLFVVSKPVATPDKTKEGKTVYANVRVGCLVLLTAENTAQYKIELTNMKLVPPSANQGLDLSFDIADTGNTHVFPVGRLAVLDGNRKLVAKAQGEMMRLLPGQKNNMKVDWSGNLPPGDYTAILTVAYGEDRIETRQVPFTVGPP
jgi:hypothetical protein